LANRRGLSFAMVFGSFLSAEAFRDLDVAVWVTAEADPAFDLALAVELSAAPVLSVDVRRINHAPLPSCSMSFAEGLWPNAMIVRSRR